VATRVAPLGRLQQGIKHTAAAKTYKGRSQMEADNTMVAMGFGLYWHSPPRFLVEPLDLADAFGR